MDFQELHVSAKVCLWSLAWSPQLDILFQSTSLKPLTKLKQNQPDIVAAVNFNALDHARSTGHLLERCLKKKFEKVTGSYPALGYSTQSVTAFINELLLRRWSSPENFAVLRMFRKTMPECHSQIPLILRNSYLANRKSSLVFGKSPLLAEFQRRVSQFALPFCMCGSAEENPTHYFFYCRLWDH